VFILTSPNLRNFIRNIKVSNRLILIHYYQNHNMHFISLHVWKGLLGCLKFILSGGESNPGPNIFSKLAYGMFDTYAQFQNFIKTMKTSFSTFIEFGNLTIHLVRIFTSVTDFVYSMLYSRMYSVQDFSFRLVSLIKNCYDTCKEFIYDKKVLIAKAQGLPEIPGHGATETLTLGFMLAYLPDNIQNIFRRMPLYTNAKLLDDTDWLYSLMGSLISIPRLILESFGTQNKVFVRLIEILHNVEDLFPFSKLQRMISKLEDTMNIVKKDPKKMVNKEIMTLIIQLERDSQELQKDCKLCRRDLPPYSKGTFERFSKLHKKVLANSNINRPEPPFFVFDGPPGTGKTTLMAEIKQMYSRAGMSIYNYANIDSNAKLFFDTYDQSDILVVDDISAVGDKLWPMFINLVSPMPVALPAADAKLKNALYFTSQLILGTTNGIPSSFEKGTITDREALYRRIIRVNFANISFDRGSYTGSVTIEKYDSTPGIKRFMPEATITPKYGNFDLEEWDTLIRNAIEVSNVMHELNMSKSNYVPAPLPSAKAQAKPFEVLNQFIDSILAKMPSWDYVLSYVFEQIASLIDVASEIDCKNETMLGIGLILSLSMGLCYGFYSYIKNTNEEKQQESVENTKIEPLHYKSNKKKPFKIKNILPQSFININSEIIPEIPQLRRYATNTIYCSFKFIDDDNKERNVKLNCLISRNKVLTVFHPFKNLGVSKEVYLTTHNKTNMRAYDSMFISLVDHDYEKDWSIWELPKNAPFYYKKINFSLDPSSSKLFLATSQTVIDLDDNINDLNSTVKYEYDINGYESLLEESSIMYDYEGEGMCGSILVTLDNAIIGMHVAGVSGELDDKLVSKGVSRLFSQRDLVRIKNHFEDKQVFVQPVIEKEHFLYLTLKEENNIIFYEIDNKVGSIKLEYFPLYVYRDKRVNEIFTSNTPTLSNNNCELLNKFLNCHDLLRNNNTILKCDIRNGIYVDNQTQINNYTPTNTMYVESPIYGVYDTLRKPAFEAPIEQHDLKMLSDQLMKETGEVDLKALNFSVDLIDQILPEDNSNLTEYEVVKGNEQLNRIDPDSSTGFNIPLDKRECLNYEEGTITSEFLNNHLIPFLDDVTACNFKYDNYAKLTRKDELKDVVDLNNPKSLPKKVRVFTACDLTQTILLRYFFGDIMSKVMIDKFANGIMIGINPLSNDWEKIINRLHKISKNNLFDGDYSSFDKAMLPIFQRKLNRILASKVNLSSANFNSVFKTNYNEKDIKSILDQLLEWMISTPIISEKKVFITNHGMPSGSALTAFYNSLINIMYISYVYKILLPTRSVSRFHMDLSYVVYGDDLVIAVSNDIKHIFTPVNFAKIMKQLGLGFTPAEKGLDWANIKPFKPISECSFLKRGFYFHQKLGEFVAPLSLVTVKSSLNYITDPLRSNELTLEKINNFQREIYLHEDIYDKEITHVVNYAKNRGISYIPLTQKQLRSLYKNQEYHEFLVLN